MSNIGPKDWSLSTKKERINEIDILRGLALIGILLVNIGLFSYPMLYGSQFAIWTDTIDRGSLYLIHFLGEGKFVSVFSFLFGLGFTIFMKRASLKTSHPIRLFSRRLFILMFIGLAHGYFIWYGDVLLIYSLLGFVLILFLHSAPTQLLRWGFFLLITPIIIFVIGALLWGKNSCWALISLAPVLLFFI